MHSGSQQPRDGAAAPAEMSPHMKRCLIVLASAAIILVLGGPHRAMHLKMREAPELHAPEALDTPLLREAEDAVMVVPTAAPTQAAAAASAPAAATPVGWPACKRPVRKLIEAMAAADAEAGWQSGWLLDTPMARRGGRRLPQQDTSNGQQSSNGSEDSGDSSSSEGGTDTEADANSSGGNAPASNSTDAGNAGGKASADGAGTDGGSKASSGRQRGSAAARKESRARGAGGSGKQPSALVAVPTANVWPKTELLLHSLAGNSDNVEILVVDELSDDGTPEQLAELGVKLLQPPERLGVTHNWNMAYREWRNSSHASMFIINNDVLVPDGVIDMLARAMTPEGGDCDLVSPMSTVRGKGFWGQVEGLEKLFWLRGAAKTFVNNPLNHRRVQAALEAGGCAGLSAVQVESSITKNEPPGYSGYFFGVRRSISNWAFDEDNLFDPANRNVKQEKDLYFRSQRGPKTRRAKVCLHTGAFVFHYKGSTIPYKGVDREAWQIPAAPEAEKPPGT